MLLKHLYDLAVAKDLLSDLAFAPKAVRWIIELDANGEFLGSGPQITGDDKRGKEFSCPQTTRPKVAGGVSEFLADGLTAVFGLDPDPEAMMTEKKRADRGKNNVRKQDDFWQQIEQAQSVLCQANLEGLLLFRQKLNSQPPAFLRWGKATEGKSDKCAWWLRTASGSEARLGAENFTFRVNGELLLENEDLRKFWRSNHTQEMEKARSGFATGLCLVSGKENQPIAPTHNPKIQGVPLTQSFGAAIVSFDKPSFGSYGFEQSLNSPTSDEAATAYCVALNWLLDRKDHSLRLGGTSLCFWTKHTEKSGPLFDMLFNRPDPKSISDYIKSPFAGIERSLAEKEQFYAVTLAGNSGRIVVRHWLQITLENAIENFQKWFSDLEISVPQRPSGKVKSAGKEKEFHPLSLYWLASTTVREAKDLHADVPAQLYRAALEGIAPSISLIKPILDQLHTRLVRDESYNVLYDESRFALLKLILNRDPNKTDMEIKPELTADTNDPAYNCGRLLALFSAVQAKAHDFKLEGPGVAERYFGTASVAPNSVFPLLLRLNRHHLNKIGKSQHYAEQALDRQIASICALFKPEKAGASPDFPRTLDLKSQGRFALGFYQQKASDHMARQESKKTTLK